MDTENRSILILFSCFVLLVFLDHQSATQLRRRGPAGGIERVMASDLLQGRESNEDGGASGPASPVPGTVDLNQPAVERSTVVPDVTLPRLKLKEVTLQAASAERMPVLASRTVGGRDITHVTLFFPAFRGRETVMVRVKRDIPGTVTPAVALQWLQKGPGPREKGLVNALDTSIPIERVEVSAGTVTVHAGPAMHRMSAAVLQDRLDQMRLTLAQFPELRQLRLVVGGQPTGRIGKGKDSVAVPAGLREGLRPTEEYRDL